VSEAATALYVYGVVSAKAQAEGTGIGSRPVELVAAGDVAALASAVSADEFGEAALRERLEDPSWLERTARQHEETLERALAGTAVIPFRLCTVYESRDGLREFLTAHGPALADLLRRLDGRVELGVKAYFAAAATERDEPASGREYLLRRQRERDAAEEAARFKADCAQASHERLGAAAEEARANQPQPPELSGRTEEMLLNGAYLVRRDDEGLARAVAELESRYGSRGVTYEVTGPWPPYNFVPREVVEP
jgi:Gas vesicle synthesis protein GvpL/GvpF